MCRDLNDYFLISDTFIKPLFKSYTLDIQN